MPAQWWDVVCRDTEDNAWVTPNVNSDLDNYWRSWRRNRIPRKRGQRFEPLTPKITREYGRRPYLGVRFGKRKTWRKNQKTIKI